MAERHTFKTRYYECKSGHKLSELKWDYDQVFCPTCSVQCIDCHGTGTFDYFVPKPGVDQDPEHIHDFPEADMDRVEEACKTCNGSGWAGKATMIETGPYRHDSSAAVHGDEIDIEIRHGLCNPDGSPRRYRSLSELKRDAYEAGWSVHGDTPNPNPRIQEERARAKEEGRASRY